MKVKRWGNTHININQKERKDKRKAEISALYTVDFEAKKLLLDKKGHFLIIKNLIQHKLTVKYWGIPKNIASKYLKKK